MNITVDLPNDLIREVKIRAVNKCKSLNDIVTELLRQGLDHPSQPLTDATPRRGTIGIPLFSTRSNAPAAQKTVEQLVAAEHESRSRVYDNHWSTRPIGGLEGCLKSDAPTATKETDGFSQAALGRHDRIS